MHSVFSSTTTSPRTTTSNFARAPQGDPVEILRDGLRTPRLTRAGRTRHRHGMLTARPLTPTGQASAAPGPASGSSTGAPKVSPATCCFAFTGGGKFTVSGGAGAYGGISGSGKVVLSIVGILGRTKCGACSENGRPVAWQQTYRGTARIKLQRPTAGTAGGGPPGVIPRLAGCPSGQRRDRTSTRSRVCRRCW